MQYPKVAIVILTYNGLACTQQFMPSVIKSNYPNLSVYVIDNASKDGTVDYISTHYPKVSIIQLQHNEGFAGGYNTGLSQIEADYYVLLNQDVEVTPNWIQPIVEQMENDISIAAAQPKILAHQQPTHFEYAGAAGGFIDYLGYPFCRGRVFQTVEQDTGQYNESTDCFWASGAALFVRGKLFQRFQGFDAHLFAHMEEIDLCWRLQRAGYHICVIPQSTVYHVGGSVINYQSPRKTYLNFRNGLVLLHKNLPFKELIWKLPVRFMLDVVAAYRELFLGKTSNYKAILKAHWHYTKGLFFWQRKRKTTQALVHQNRIAKNYSTTNIYAKSIVWQYFIKKNKQFNELPQIMHEK